MKSQLTINIKTEENKGILRNNHKYLSSIINKQFKTITPSFRRLSNLRSQKSKLMASINLSKERLFPEIN
jgi:hypothetical protein